MRNRHLVAGGRLAAGFLLIGLLFLSFYPLTRTTAQEVSVPEAVADAERGLLLYETRCATCHGLTGDGDGERAPQSVQPPAVFSDPAFRLTAVPSEMYNTIMNGRMDQGMPPFGPENSNPLSDQDAWDLIAAVYSFSTPGDSFQQGQELFATEINLEADIDLTDLSFWATQSNETIADRFRSEGILLNDGLTDDEVLALIDFGRGMMSYTYTDPLAAAEPIETAVVSGEITNGTIEQTAGDLVVSLRAFTQELQESYNVTTTVGIDGRYTFDLEQVPPDWIYLVSTEYKGFQFSSSPAVISAASPELDMPVTVYDTTTDAGVVSIDQVHTIMTFVDDLLEVTQFYRFTNGEPALYVGPTGNVADGTVEIMLPAGAQNATFERGFGSMESFIPAAEIIQTETGWADTLPLRPGQGVFDLLVTYALPYEDGMRFAHPLPYPVTQGTLVMPDAGVELEAQGWALTSRDEFSGGTFLNYTNSNMTGVDALSFVLNGEPEQVFDVQGNVMPVRNETNDLIIGGASLLVAVGAAIFMVQSWRTQADDIEDDPDELLAAIVELDEDFEAGEVSRAEYEEEREALKEALMDIWEDGYV
ncbi:MAG: cytochrome c [Anaerolineales bacterium]|nr:cytochrome c [Anaerolineales bacterium]